MNEKIISKLLKAKKTQQPVDIFYNYETDGVKKCIIEFEAFLVLEVDEIEGTFSGYDKDQRGKNDNTIIQQEGCINVICDIQQIDDDTILPTV